jgi:hypothetical protein
MVAGCVYDFSEASLSQSLLWILFNLFVLGMLALDLGLLQRPGHVAKYREAVV